MQTCCAVVKYVFESPSSASVLPVTEELCFQPCTYYLYPLFNFIVRSSRRGHCFSGRFILYNFFKAFYIFQGDMYHNVRAECTPGLKKKTPVCKCCLLSVHGIQRLLLPEQLAANFVFANLKKN